ncbi:OLC1v1027414C1 [Oldenlandia corymbosa var. corymbosa]|uniref:OLC1v1027414C1 n=1 Tax=Oldenlandia corymbosa var. corymbosa TaxID=529605 RepID=A0AAV1C9X2_OLDCO|nr:OLC1v1027414C1 [Oldenlandia corymbosa var. corymbosa]
MKIKERFQSIVNGVSGRLKDFAEKIWLPTWLVKTSVARSSSLAILFLVCLCVGAFVSTRFLDSCTTTPMTAAPNSQNSIFTGITSNRPSPDKLHQSKSQLQLNCWPANSTRKCPSNYYPSNHSAEKQNHHSPQQQQQPICPEYFRWIHQDLWPWRETGITAEMVEAANKMKSAFYRLVIVNGTAYLQTHMRCFQTRDVFTQWGILQLLRLYPAQIPDLDLVFNCGDLPAVPKETYPKPNAQAPPPLFSYDGNNATSDIIFPDWSFWGWPEINIKPWEALSKELKEGNEQSKWINREPYAYWKGNPHVSPNRMDLLKCGVSDKQDWNARIYVQDWFRETRQGFRTSKLADQCKHRYKIYIEGRGWSVSEKYILACDSLSLIVNTRFDHFFTRSLMPLQHYWPIRDDDKCRSIKSAVEWGNSHPKEAQAIGRAASKFIQEELHLSYVYDYMFHLLTEYAKLLTYKPVIPPKAVELCSESMACPAQGLMKKYMMDSLVSSPSDVPPCTMPPPYDPSTLHSILERKRDSLKQVEMWEKEYWGTHK